MLCNHAPSEARAPCCLHGGNQDKFELAGLGPFNCNSLLTMFAVLANYCTAPALLCSIVPYCAVATSILHAFCTHLSDTRHYRFQYMDINHLITGSDGSSPNSMRQRLYHAYICRHLLSKRRRFVPCVLTVFILNGSRFALCHVCLANEASSKTQVCWLNTFPIAALVTFFPQHVAMITHASFDAK